MRRGELSALLWRDLDLEVGLVHVRAGIDAVEGRIDTKSREHRAVPLGRETIARLRRWRLASPRSLEADPVFPEHPRYGWQRARKAAVLAPPAPRFHDLRHTCAVHWLAAGLTVHAVAELLGHADASLVLRTYGHALPSEVATAGDRLEAWRAGRIATRSATRADSRGETPAN
jgi:integrase